MNVIIVKDIINSTSAVSPQAGEPIFGILAGSIAKKEELTLDFTDMEYMTTAFLNSAIGQLYAQFDPETIARYLKIKNITNSSAFSLQKVVQAAKVYFSKIKRP